MLSGALFFAETRCGVAATYNLIRYVVGLGGPPPQKSYNLKPRGQKPQSAHREFKDFRAARAVLGILRFLATRFFFGRSDFWILKFLATRFFFGRRGVETFCIRPGAWYICFKPVSLWIGTQQTERPDPGPTYAWKCLHFSSGCAFALAASCGEPNANAFERTPWGHTRPPQKATM